MNNIELVPIQSKVTLNPFKCPDGWFWTNTSINPYRGCQFDCTYCDGKANWYNIPNFETKIRIKENFPKLLEKELIKWGYKGKNRYNQKALDKYLNFSNNNDNEPKKFLLSVGGGVTDCYQPVEKETKFMRKIIKILIDFEIPSFFLTKSSMIKRDLDLIGELNDVCYASINISVAFSDPKERLIFEPNSSSTEARFYTLKNFREQGIPGGLSMMPILPFICDTEENLRNLLKLAKDNKAEYALIAGLTLKPGNRELFFEKFSKYYPNLIEPYSKIFPENNTYGTPKSISGLKNVMKIGHYLCEEYGIKPRIPRYIPQGCLINNYRLAENLEYYLYYNQYISNLLTSFEKKDLRKAICKIENLSTDIKEIDEQNRKNILNISESTNKLISNELIKI